MIDADGVVQILSFCNGTSIGIDKDFGAYCISFPEAAPSRRNLSRSIFVRCQWLIRGMEDVLWFRSSCRRSRRLLIVAILPRAASLSDVSILGFALTKPNDELDLWSIASTEHLINVSNSLQCHESLRVVSLRYWRHREYLLRRVNGSSSNCPFPRLNVDLAIL